ncbi:MAG TPA: AAA family ATPase [Xanthobacteraceae bacterium]
MKVQNLCPSLKWKNRTSRCLASTSCLIFGRASGWCPNGFRCAYVTLLSGEGSIGKSLLLMQLSGATALGKDWIGTRPAQGPVLYLSCEEDDDEVRRRTEAVAVHFSAVRQDLIEYGLRVLSFAGRDSILGQPDRDGIIRPTPLFDRLRRDALQLRPKLIVLDTVADIFGGKENDRAQTRQFVTMQRGLAIDTGSAVVIVAHPSLTGIATDTGLSGSTGWHNSVRARMYLKTAPGNDTTLRMLEVKKNNYGPVSENILLRWCSGVYVVEPGEGSFEQLMADAKIENLFLALLRRFTAQGRNVSDKPSPSYALAAFTAEPEAKEAKASKQALVEAMARLFATNKIRVVSFGPQSKMRTKIVVSNDPSNSTSNASQPVPTGVWAHTPNTPVPVGRGKGALGAPAPPNGDEAAEPLYQVLGPAPPGERCTLCGKGSDVKRIKRGGAVNLLHEYCAGRYLAARADPLVKLPDLGPDTLDDHGRPERIRISHSESG